ncbi:TPA: hypothetical protein L4873_006518, partial [Pseudomonas aeruginosa]|nr:hypothetical protein [Pseudomonas aeruginosa]
DQAASIQRRVTTCGGRRKTQPTVRDGLTTTVCSKFIRLACEKYLQRHPEDTEKVKELLDKLSFWP